ncbi:FtsH-like AAA+ protein [Haematococcus lacustris]
MHAAVRQLPVARAGVAFVPNGDCIAPRKVPRRQKSGRHLDCPAVNRDQPPWHGSNAQGSQPGEGAAPPSPQMVAAMALSPLAALSLPLIQSEAWQASAASFAADLRLRLQQRMTSEGFKQWARSLDDEVTFMDGSYKLTGLDLRHVWDPELWTRFKIAVWLEQPAIFWNKLLDKVAYQALIPRAGLVGDMRISYSKFLQLLEGSRVKRVVVFGDMRTALVEVPHPWYASVVGAPGTYPFVEDREGRPVSLLVPHPDAPEDPLQWYCPEMPEWNMEKYRFYVDLPGDFWEAGVMLRYLRAREVQVEWDAGSRQYLMPLRAFPRVKQVRTEVQVLDPSDSWQFLGWLNNSNMMNFYEKTAAVCLFFRGVTLLMDWASGTPAWAMWTRRKKKKKSKEEKTWEKLTTSTAREFMTKDKTGKVRDTGVRFKDIAGLDHIVVEMKELVKILLRDPAYVKVGAKLPRGIIFQGPPGTGKTYLARAIAGEAGVAFFSSVGSEFVEMFAGVAAARVNSLFNIARKKSPAIIFIDEIDAIGRARSTGGADPGSLERESALLAMLVQMDGIHGRLESVLTIGATNLVKELDAALLRPGRFEVIYEIPTPDPTARLEILRYHSRNKALESQDMLFQVAQATQGWSAASLENLMNEAAILTVRRNVPQISEPMLMELVAGSNSGPLAPRIPDSEAKNRLAYITAAKAVAMALTPGIEPIRSVTLWSKEQGEGPYITFDEFESSTDPEVHPELVEIMDWATNIKVNAATIGDQHLGEFLHLVNLLVPMYAPRAAEVAEYGPDAASLASASFLSDCFEIAYFCVRQSQAHPRFKSLPPLHTNVWLGIDDDGADQEDPLLDGFDLELGYHQLTLTLLKASWRRAMRLVVENKRAIKALATELLEDEEETVSGPRVVELIEEHPLSNVDHLQLNNQFLPLIRICEADLVAVSRAVMGRLDIVDLIGRNTAVEIAERVADALLDPDATARLAAVARYLQEDDAPFPPRPLGKEVPRPNPRMVQDSLEAWKPRNRRQVSWSAQDLLLTPRQRELYGRDADQPRDEDAAQVTGSGSNR